VDIRGAITGNITGNLSGSIGTVSANGIANASFAADTGHKTIRSNTATAGGATSITLDAGASATNDYYKNDLIYITGGTGIGQARFITAYVGATQVATVAAWATAPDATSTFAILPFDAVVSSAPTAAQVATAVWQDATAGDFTVASSIGKSLYTGGVVPGASTGLFIAGANAATTVNITGNLSGSVGSVTGNVGGNVTGNVGGNVTGTVGSVVGNVGGNVTGSVASVLNTIITSGTIQSAGGNSAVLANSASAVDNFYNNQSIIITGGTGAGQVRTIEDYIGATRAITITAPWVTTPDNTSTYIVTISRNFTGTDIADTILDRNLASGPDTGTDLTIRTVRQCLRTLRNKWSISGSQITYTKEDDATTCFTAALTTNPAATPVVGSTPD
jgi:hypothetical protein